MDATVALLSYILILMPVPDLQLHIQYGKMRKNRLTLTIKLIVWLKDNCRTRREI